MVTFAQAQERAEEWINGDVPAYQHREVRVREFGLGFVVWGEDRAEGPRSDAGGQRLVIARDSGEATLWPALPVGEVVRRYEEEYGREAEVADAVPAPAARVDLNQTSFLLSPPEWLQEAADKLGIPDRRSGGDGASAGAGAGSVSGSGSGPGSGSGSDGLAETQAGVPGASGGAGPAGSGGASWPPAAAGAGAGAAAGARGAASGLDVPAGATPWAGTDTNADAGEDRSVPLPATVFAPPLGDADDGVLGDAETALMAGGSQLPRTAVSPALDDASTREVRGRAPQGGTPEPPPRDAPSYGYPQGPAAPGAPAQPQVPAPSYGYPQAPPAPGYGYPQVTAGAGPGAPQPPVNPANPAGPANPAPPAAPPGPAGPAAPSRPLAPNASDIAEAATSRAAPPPRRARGGAGAPPPPPGVPGAPGAHPAGTPQPPAPAAGYAPTQMVSAQVPEGPETPAQVPGPQTPPGAPDSPRTPGVPGNVPPGHVPPGDAHRAATMLAGPSGVGGGAQQPPGAPGVPPAPGAPQPPNAPGVPPAPGGAAVHHAETVLAAPPVVAPGAPGMPPGAPQTPPRMPPQMPPPMPAGAMPPPGQPVPGQPPGYGYPQQGQPTVGPGYQAVLRYRAQDGSEQQLIRRSAPGTPHPEWQIFHELRAMNVPPDQVLELHTELEPCELPGAYCARMIREQWPQARLASIAPYGTDHASRQQGMRQLLAHQGELHQVAAGPARPAPVRAPLPQVQAAPPVPPEAIAQELAAAFGPGMFRFEQAAVSRQGVPPIVAHTLVVAGLPLDMGPFFWAQAQPGRPVPTLAELAQERGLQPASDAASYLVMGTDFGKALCVQYGTANIVAVPVEAGPGGASVPPQFVNTGLPEFARCLALLGRMWRLRFGLNQEQAGRWTVDFQAQLASLDPAALGSPESWWSVLLEQMWDGLL
ncbi:SUKH-4 family immunity protein [Streptomyces shenzhenensis]|uniref:SUKH-4 family immunity protein n=1 Tax=Streptomyces shenzhenensis TaxID=943815 RepID=UPI001F219450|nr:SUKH-4 family immunity protein [Streptomyces shenzhenensis]